MATVVVSQHILIDYYCNNVLLNEERLVRWVTSKCSQFAKLLEVITYNHPTT